MSFLNSASWRRIRVVLLGVFMLAFVVGVFVVMHTGPAITPMAEEAPSTSGEDFGQYLADHYDLLAPFFEKNRPDLLTKGAPLIIRVFGDLILLNMGISWVLAVGLGLGFAYLYARRHANLGEALIYSSFRVVLDIAVLFVSTLAALGWEEAGVPLPVAIILVLFVVIDVIVQSMLVASIFHTSASLSTTYYVGFLLILITVCALISGSLIKKRLSILASQFADVPSVTADLLVATAESQAKLGLASASRDEAKRALDDAQAKLDEIKAQQDALLKSIDDKKNSEAYVFGRIIRIRASGDLISARDQMTAFLVKFPNGTLIEAAKAQLVMINQDIVTQAAQEKQAAADAAQAAALARADLLARAAQGQVPIDEMRHALLGKTRDDVNGLFGKPMDPNAQRWDYDRKMIMNPLTKEQFGLSVYFSQDVVQSVDYYHGN